MGRGLKIPGFPFHISRIGNAQRADWKIPSDSREDTGRTSIRGRGLPDAGPAGGPVLAAERGSRLSVATVAPIAALLFSIAFLLMGNGLQNMLLPVRAHAERFTTLDIGVLGAAYFLGFGVGCFAGPHIVRRAGHVRSFTAMVSLASALGLAHAIAVAPAVWWFCRALSGFSLAVLFMVIESWLNEKSTNENRGRVFSLYRIVNFSVIVIGQLLLTLGDPRTFALFAGASILISLAALPVAFSRAEAPRRPDTVRLGALRRCRGCRVGFAGIAAVGLANGAFWSLAPVFVQTGIGWNSDLAAILMSLAVMAGALGQWPLAQLSDRTDRRRAVVLASIAGAFAGAGAALCAGFWKWELGPFVFFFLFGLSALPLYTLCAAHMNDSVESGGFVEASSALLLLFSLGAAGGSLAGSVAMGFLGPAGLFSFTAAVHVALAAFATARMRLSPLPPGRERSPDPDGAAPAAPLPPEPAAGLGTAAGALRETPAARSGGGT